MRKAKQIISLVCIFVMVLSMFAGCAGSKTNTQASNTKAAATAEAKQPPLKLKALSVFYSTETPKDDDPIKKQMEGYTNTQLEITWAPKSNFDEKVNVTIASGDFPDILLGMDMKAQSVVTAEQTGLFWELGPYFKDFKNLSRLNPIVLNNVSLDGKVYCVYRERDLARNGFYYRKDWADALGLSAPKTPEDVYNMMKAFTYNDPDKDGKNNTLGAFFVGTYAVVDMVGNIMSWFGAPNYWGVVNGKMTPSFATPEFLTGLKYIKRLYDEKVINQDFPIAQNKNQFALDKIGMNFTTLTNSQSDYLTLKKINPNTKDDVYEIVPKLANEKKYSSTAGYSGAWMIPKTKGKTEAEVKKILAFFDKLLDSKMQDLMYWGVEGVNYVNENGSPKRTEDQVKQWDASGRCWNEFLILRDAYNPGKLEPLQEKANAIIRTNSKDCLPNLSDPYISKTYSDKKAELDKTWQDAFVKFIIGQLDEAGWNSMVESWKQKGGSKVMDEYTEQYMKAQKK